MNPVNITILILTKNASESIRETLESIKFAAKIIALDDNSTDLTKSILEEYGVEIHDSPESDFSEKRNVALSLVSTEWLMYVDADEEVTPELAKKVGKIAEINNPGAFRIKRRNIFLGTEMYPDYVDRLFHKSMIRGWRGKVHESPVINGNIKVIEEALIHHTHRDISAMLTKTNSWSEYEADLRLQAGHPPIKWWRLIRIGLTFWWRQFVILKIGRFGRSGLFEGYFQIIDKLIVYTKLWERQQKVK